MTRYATQRFQVLLYVVLVVATFALPLRVALAVPADLPVQGPPTITRDLFVQVLQTAGSPAVGEAGAIWDAGVTMGIDPAFALAVFKHESIYGTAQSWIGRILDGYTYNWGNLKCGDYPHCDGEWRVYTSWLEGATDFYALLRDGSNFIPAGRTTVVSIIPMYAPSSDNNNVQAYIQDVLTSMDGWRNGQVTPGNPTGGSSWFGFDLDKSVNAPMDAFTYDRYRQLAQLGWQWNGSNFQFVDTLIGLRSTVLAVFEPLLNDVGATLLDLAQWILVIAVTIAGLSLAIRPIHDLRVVNVSTAFKLAVLLPLLLPGAGMLYAWTEGWRDDMTRAVGNTVFEDASASAVLQPDVPPIPEENRQMDTVDAFAADGMSRPALDVAGAFLWSESTDLQTVENGLPLKFQQRYFSRSGEEMKTLGPVERRDALDQAWTGVLRMAIGTVVSLMAVLDELLRSTWTVGTTVLGVAVILASIWALFAPGRRLVLVLAHELGTVFLASMVFGAVQAFFVALVYHQGNAGLPGNTVGAATLAICVTALFLVVAVIMVGLSFLNTYQVVSDSNALTKRFHKVMGQRVRGALPSGTEQTSDDGTSKKERALAYASARRQGASRTWAASYALSTAGGVTPTASTLMALGKLPAEIEHGVLAGAVSARGQLTSLRGQLAVKRQVATWKQRETDQGEMVQALGRLVVAHAQRKQQAAYVAGLPPKDPVQEQQWVDHFQARRAQFQQDHHGEYMQYVGVLAALRVAQQRAQRRQVDDYIAASERQRREQELIERIEKIKAKRAQQAQSAQGRTL
jgi:hypothetical protein